MSHLTRRQFVQKTALAAAATQLVSALRASETAASTVPAASRPLRDGVAELHWLDGKRPAALPGTTWGVPWPRGKYPKGATFALSANGAGVPVQSWPLAFWPDGSLKWTAHAISADAPAADLFELSAGNPANPAKPLAATDSAAGVDIDTGVIAVRIAKSGAVLVPAIQRDGREILRNGRLVLLNRTQPAGGEVETFAGEIGQVTLEQAGPVRAVVKIEGRHRAATGRAWLPFIVRLYFYAGSDAIRVLHTIVFDGDHNKDFISGLGVRFDVPLRGELHDRHVRFSGQDAGLFAEAVRGITGLRRDPGHEVKEAQLAGRATPPLSQWNEAVSSRLQYVPAFGDWSLLQPNSDGFEIRKRTRDGYTWLNSMSGQRAGGLGYVGTPDGGVAFGIRNFWQSFPAQLDISGATGDAAEVTAWLWAPGAGAMDLRSYHDGMGQDTYDKQYNGGLEITYEDYEPGFDSPEGVARTSELMLWAVAATPTRERLVNLAETLRQPPRLVPSPEYLHACDVFGGLWSPVDRSTPARADLEDKLAWRFEFYLGQREQRRWYGFWNYGDVMHTYDADRHTWRYDVGGFAWDNSELSTDLWLWMYFLKSGRADVFHFAEAMTRHTGEVDVHHLGRFAPLGSRHNVLHWGDSGKQLRIATATNRRYYYYLTGDERVGDLMREQIEAGRALLRVPPGRKLGVAKTKGDQARGENEGVTKVGVSFGTDWGSLAGAWLTEWERTGDPKMFGRLREGMRTLGAQPRGFFSTDTTINLETGAFAIPEKSGIGLSHLNAVFGLVEVCAELIQLIDVPEFRRAWLDYCELYNASPAEQKQRLGQALQGNSLTQGHSRLTAYAAKLENDPVLAQRAWNEFSRGSGRQSARGRPQAKEITGPAVLRPVDEAAWISTNDSAQWGLAAIECLALIGDAIPPA